MGIVFDQSLNTTDSVAFNSVTVDTDGGVIGSDYLRLKNTTGSVFYVGVNARIIHDSTGFYPNPDGGVSVGKDERRFSDIYSVDGDFSGRVLTGRLENLDGLSYIRVSGLSTSPIKLWRDTAPQGDNAFDMGAAAERFSTVYSVAGDFSGDVSVYDLASTNADFIIDQAASASGSIRFSYAGDQKWFLGANVLRPVADNVSTLGNWYRKQI